MTIMNRRDVLKLAVVGGASATAAGVGRAEQADPSDLKGTWIYRSYLINPGPIDKADAQVVAWAPPGELEVKTATDGTVEGTLKFPSGAVLKIEGKVVPSIGTSPAGVELTGKGAGPLAAVVYEIKGWFVPKAPETYRLDGAGMALEPVDAAKARPNVRGSVRNLGPDLRKAETGTVGTFVLVPK